MNTFIHRTLRNGSYILDVVKGTWHPTIETPQFVINFQTSLGLYTLVAKETQAQLMQVIHQPFFARVMSICIGPKRNNLDTIYVLRESDILQLEFSQSERLFTLCRQHNLPSLCCCPSRIFWEHHSLIVSSHSGGLCCFDLNSQNHRPTFLEKPTNCVLNTFITEERNFGRIETDSSIAIYGQDPFQLISKQSFDNNMITNALCFLNGMVVCFSKKIIFIDEQGQRSPVQFISDDTKIKFDSVVDSIVISDDTAIFITSKGFVMKLNTNLKLTFLFQIAAVSRIFPLTDQFVLLTVKGGDHIIFNISQKKAVGMFPAIVGLRKLYVGSQCSYLAPHAVSYYGNHLILTQQGVSLAQYSCVEIADPMYGMKTFEYGGKTYAYITHNNSTRYLEISEGEVKQISNLGLKETVQTLSVTPLKGRTSTILAQIYPECLSLVGLNSSKEYSLSGCVSCCASNNKQIVIAFANRKIHYICYAQELETVIYDVPFQTMCVSLSKPDPSTGFSEYVAFGATEGQGNGAVLKITTISIDTAARTNILTERMPAVLSSIEFFDNTRICIGLENGCVICGEIDPKAHRFDYVQVIHLGIGPTRLAPISIRQQTSILAYNSRSVHLQINQDIIQSRPISTYPLSFASPVGGKGQILTISGKTLALKAIASPKGKLVSISKAKAPSPITDFLVLEKTHYIIVACANCLYMYDVAKNSNQQPFVQFDGEKIISMSASRVLNEYKNGTSFLGVVTRSNKSKKSILRLYTITCLNQCNVQFSNPVVGRIDREINAVCCIILSNNGHLVAATNTDLYFFKQVKTVNGAELMMAGLPCENIGVSIKYLISTNENLIYVGDAERSVKLVKYDDERKEFQALFEEGFPRKISAISQFQDTSICGGDCLGNVFIFEHSPILACQAPIDQELFNASRRLTMKLNYYIGDVITGTYFTSDQCNYLWYSTVCGEFGGFMIPGASPSTDWLTEYTKELKLLKNLEIEITTTFFMLTGGDQISFRNKHYPACNVIDLDVIDLFTKFSDERKLKIAKKVTELLKIPTQKPNDGISVKRIEFEISKFKNYFWYWQKKGK